MVVELVSVTLREQDGRIIQPWKDVPDLQGYEWINDAISLVGGEDPRTIPVATYQGSSWAEAELPDGKKSYFKATFTSDGNGKPYTIAERLIPRGLQTGDKVRIVLLGCCNIISIDKLGIVSERDILVNTSKSLETELIKEGARSMWGKNTLVNFETKPEDLSATTSDTKSSKKKMSTSSTTTKATKSSKKTANLKKGKKGSKGKKTKGSY